MVLLMALGVAYAAYAANQQLNESQKQKEKEKESTPEIDPLLLPFWRELSHIRFLPHEREFSMFELPVITVTWYQGDYRAIENSLRLRVEAVMDANPWLGGWVLPNLDRDGEIEMFFDPTGQRRSPDHFVVCDDGPVVDHMKAAYSDYTSLIDDSRVCVLSNTSLIGKNLPLFKVAIIPDGKQPDNMFALVISLSHQAADARTYYNVFNMLDLAAKKPVIRVLDPHRRMGYFDKLKDSVGTDVNYLLNSIADGMRGEAASEKPQWQQLLEDHRDVDEDDPLVHEQFIVNPSWIAGQRFDCMGQNPDASPPSDNAILASWFFTINRVTVGFIGADLRYHLPHVLEDDNDEDTSATMESEKPKLDPYHVAGNYVYCVPYTPSDYGTPDLIRRSFSDLRRCGTTPPLPLPQIDWGKSYCSVSVDWSRIDHSNRKAEEATGEEMADTDQEDEDENVVYDALNLGGGTRQLMHFPLLSAQGTKSSGGDELAAIRIPNKLSFLITFSAGIPRDIDGRAPEQRCLGATVICRRSIWRDVISRSGVVRSMMFQKDE